MDTNTAYVIFLILSLTVTRGGAKYVGCYREISRPRHFGRNPGNYDPEKMSITKCRKLCADHDLMQMTLPFAALSGGKYCFCGETLPADSLNSTDPSVDCNIPCSGQNAEICGGYRKPAYTFVSVNTVPKVVQDLMLQADKIIVAVNEAVVLTATAKDGLDGEDYLYSVDCGEGVVETIPSPSYTNSFSTPGTYTCTITVQDADNIMVPKSASVVIEVEAKVGMVELNCPPVVVSAMEFRLNGTVHLGTGMESALDYDDASKDDFAIADTSAMIIGPGIPSNHTGGGESTGDVLYIPRCDQFSAEGTLDSLEYCATQPGTIEFVVLAPECSSGSYCFRTNDCSGSCTPEQARTCSGLSAFYSSAGVCCTGSGCSSVTDRCTSTPDYTKTHVISHTISESGCDVMEIPSSDQPIHVGIGYTIGYVSAAGQAKLATRSIVGTEVADYMKGTVPSASGISTVSGLSTDGTNKHLLRAVAYASSSIEFVHELRDAGEYVLSLNVSNKYLPGSWETTTCTVTAAAGINETIISADDYGITGESVTFTILPHSGSNVTYEWQWGDGSNTTTVSRVATHTFATKGTFNVSVRSYNKLNGRENQTQIIIQTRVSGIGIFNGDAAVGKNHDLHINLTSGSDYTCDISLGTPGDTLVTNETQTPVGGSEITHVFPSQTTYLVTATCKNALTQDSGILTVNAIYPITNLTLALFGAKYNTQFDICWSIDTGTNTNWEFEFDGNPIAINYTESLLKGCTLIADTTTMNTGVYNVTVRGWNKVSNEILVDEFTIDEFISLLEVMETTQGETATEDVSLATTIDILTGGSVSIRVNMAGGTSVTVKWDWQDSSVPDTFYTGQVVRWDPAQPQNRSHIYSVPGVYTVAVEVSNNFEAFKRYIKFAVYNEVKNLTLNSDSPAPFFEHGRSSIKLFFTTPDYPPTLANVSFNFGDSQSENYVFDIATQYEHVYQTKSTYTVTANVSNKISWGIFETNVTLITPVVNLRIRASPPEAVAVIRSMRICAAVEAGDEVTYHWSCGNNQTFSQKKQALSLYDISQDCFDCIYNTVGNYEVMLRAENGLGNTSKTYIAQAQNPVTRAFVVNSTAPLVFNGGSARRKRATSGTKMEYILRYPSSLPLPSDASVTVCPTGDKAICEPALPLSLTLGSAGWFEQIIEHIFTVAGHYTSIITIFNTATSMDFSVSGGVYAPFTSVDFDVKWSPLVPVGEIWDGEGINKNIFGNEQPIKVYPLVTGTAALYTLDIVRVDNSIVKVCNATPANTPIVTLLSEIGTYNVTLTAENPIESVSASRLIIIDTAIGDITINDTAGSSRANEERHLRVNFGSIDVSAACVEVDFGDGSSAEYYGPSDSVCQTFFGTGSTINAGVLTAPLDLTHTYTSKGTYSVTVTGKNNMNVMETTIEVTVSSSKCYNPKVSITGSSSCQNPMKHVKKNGLALRGQVDTTTMICDNFGNVSRSWKVYRVDKKYCNVSEELDVSNIYSHDKTDLKLEGGFFPDYTVYKVCFTFMMTPGAESYKGEGCTFLQITKSPLSCKFLQSGLSQTVQRGSSGGNVTFNAGEYSADPDLPSGSNMAAGIIFKAFCKTETNSEWSEIIKMSNITAPISAAELLTKQNDDDGGCYRDGGGPLLTQEGLISFDSSVMRENETYEFHVSCEKDDRISDAFLKVDIVPGETINCLILRHTSNNRGTEASFYNLHERLVLEAECKNNSDHIINNPQCEWSLERKGIDRYFYPIYDVEKYTSGLESTSISISNEIFPVPLVPNEFVPLKAKLSCELPNTAKGVSEMILDPNLPPEAGTCSLDRYGGTTGDSIICTCTGWQDPDEPERISGVIIKAKNERWSNGSFIGYLNYEMGCVARDTDDAFIRECLPKEGNTTITAVVTDSRGGQTEVNLPTVTMNAASVEEAESIVNDILSGNTKSSDVQALAVGSYEQTLKTIVKITNIIESADETSDTGVSFKDLAAAQIQYILDIQSQGSKNEQNATTAQNPADALDAEEQEKLDTIRDQNTQTRDNLMKHASELGISSVEEAIQLSSSVNAIVEPYELSDEGALLAVEVNYNIINQLQNESMSLVAMTELAENMLSGLNKAQTAQIVSDVFPAKTSKAKVVDVAYFDASLNSKKPAFKSEEEMYIAFHQEKQSNEVVTQAEQFLVGDKTIISKIASKFNDVQIKGEKTYVDVEHTPACFETNEVSKMIGVVQRAELDAKDTFRISAGSVLEQGDPQAKLTLCMLARDRIYVPGKSSVSTSVVEINAVMESKYNLDTGNLIPTGGDPLLCVVELTFDTKMSADEKLLKKVKYGLPKKKEGYDAKYAIFHTVSIEESEAVCSKLSPARQNLTYLVLFGCGNQPNFTVAEDKWENVLHWKVLPDYNQTDPWMTVLSNYMLGNIACDVVVAVRQLSGGEYTEWVNSPHDIPKPELNIQQEDVFDAEGFNLTINKCSCSYVKSTTEAGQKQVGWSGDGMYVKETTTLDSLVCCSNHMTVFGGGFAVKPNVIDWNFVFSNLDFFKNPTLYITEIVILIVYILAMVWARRQDKKDVLKLGIAPLPDNDPSDKYLYEVIVYTGVNKQAGTESKVQFILSGEYAETDVRFLEDKERKILKRGAVDAFLMTTPRPLGGLHFMRVWHDNSGEGKFASWYLKYIIVRDIHTKQEYYFICNRWFAVEHGDGQVERLLPVAGKEQMTEFSHLFAEKTKNNLSDDHIWFSVVARPPQSRFTRMQRVSCCLLLLYCSMLGNALFYGVATTGSNKKVFALGPFALTPEQLYVGLIVNLLVFPVNFLVVFMFRKSRPFKKRPSRIKAAIDRMNKQNISDPADELREELKNSFYDTGSDTGNSVDMDEEAGLVTSPGSQEALSKQFDPITTKAKSKNKKFSLHWGFRIFAWILLWAVTLVSAAFTTFYGIMFGDIKCKKWISSMLVSFASSVFFSQPIKVLLVAAFMSLVWRNPNINEDDGDEDEEEIELASDEQYAHAIHDDLHMANAQRKVVYQPLDDKKLEAQRQLRLKEIKMYDIFREIVFYGLFLWCLLVISYNFRDPNAFLLKKALQNTLTDEGMGHLKTNYFYDYKQISTTVQFWNWMEHRLVPALRAGRWYNGDWLPGQRGFLEDRTSRIMGFATLRQLRVSRGECHIIEKVHHLSECNIEYSIAKEDTRTFGVGWTPFSGNATHNNTKYEYVYRSGRELKSWPYWAHHALYSGGGYVVELKGSTNQLYDIVREIKQDKWVDRYTRAVFIEFTIYNPFTNLFGIVTLAAEMLATGGVFPYLRIEPVNLLGYQFSTMIFELICQIVYLIFILFFLYKEVRQLLQSGKVYFTYFWSWVEMSIIIISVAGAVIFFYRLVQVNALTAMFKASHGNEYIKFQYVGYWNELLLYMVGWLVFLANIKFLKLLRFNRRIGLLASTLKNASQSLLWFAMMFFVMYFAYAQFFYLIYFFKLRNFSTFLLAMEQCMQMLLGKFDFFEMQLASPVMGPLWFFGYTVSITYILINMFLTILNESFSDVRYDIEKQSNDYEMVEFIVKKFKVWTGIGNVKKEELFEQSNEDGADGQEAGDMDNQSSNQGYASSMKPAFRAYTPVNQKDIERFPKRVDKLLKYISSVYFPDQRWLEAVAEKKIVSVKKKEEKARQKHRQKENKAKGKGKKKQKTCKEVDEEN